MRPYCYAIAVSLSQGGVLDCKVRLRWGYCRCRADEDVPCRVEVYNRDKETWKEQILPTYAGDNGRIQLRRRSRGVANKNKVPACRQ